jgi:hypothetical protein
MNFKNNTNPPKPKVLYLVRGVP